MRPLAKLLKSVRFQQAAVVTLLASLTACAGIGRPKTIYLARHGQTEWNRVARFQGDPDLDPVGYINRVSLWRLLKDKPLRAIYTSERLRTKRTAALLAKQHKLEIMPRAALNEIEPGVFEGICYYQVAPSDKLHPKGKICQVKSRGAREAETVAWLKKTIGKAWKKRLKGRLPQGENYYDIVKRVDPFLKHELYRRARSQQILIVGHGVLNRVLLHRLMKWPLKNVSYLRQENDQVYKLRGRKLSLFTPGHGWKPCSKPKPGQRYLDCNPGPKNAAHRLPPANATKAVVAPAVIKAPAAKPAVPASTPTTIPASK
jgi:broad specificity phosphatase PhoE